MVYYLGYRGLFEIIAEGGSFSVDYQVDPPVIVVAAHLSQVDFPELRCTVEQLILTVPFEHWLVQFVCLDHLGLLLRSVGAESHRERVT
mgnify:CR=1 FL=1